MTYFSGHVHFKWLRKSLKKLQRPRDIVYFCLSKYFGRNVCQKWTFVTEILLSGIHSRFQLACIAWRFVSSNCFLNRQATQARFIRALVLFWQPDIINFLLKSLSVITSEQNKQIYSFDELEMHTHSIVLVGVKPIISAIPFNDF